MAIWKNDMKNKSLKWMTFNSRSTDHSKISDKSVIRLASAKWFGPPSWSKKVPQIEWAKIKLQEIRGYIYLKIVWISHWKTLHVCNRTVSSWTKITSIENRFLKSRTFFLFHKLFSVFFFLNYLYQTVWILI